MTTFIFFLVFIISIFFRKEIRNEISKLNFKPISFNYLNTKIEKLNFDNNRFSKIYDFNGISAHSFCRENTKYLNKNFDVLKNLNCMHKNINSRKLIVLIGDSHSFHYLPGMKKLFNNYNFHHSYIPCLFSNKFASINKTEINKDERILECFIGIQNMISKIKNFEQIYGKGNVSVIISQNLYGRLIKTDVYDSNLKHINNKDLLYKMYYENLKFIISNFNSQTKIFVIMPTPNFRNIEGISLICVLNERKFCEIDNSANKKKFEKVFEIYNKIEKYFLNVSIIDFTEELCPNQKCKVYNRETDDLFFSDNNHLSLEFSRKISPKINNIFIRNDK